MASYRNFSRGHDHQKPTDAAQLVRTSQPTVSREISRLESLLRFKLFDRIKGRLLPTA
ncbi:MAG: LysR family transcriptional regulator [Candidatus Arsenophonus phytopathogenicus]